MRQIVMIAAAALMAFGMGTPELEAQMRSQSGWSVHAGTGFGYPGYRGGVRGNRGFFPYAFNDFYNPYSFNRPEPQPYFAMNPPVYYSDQIVRRPMGISPYPVPPGVTPVEMTVRPAAKVMQNPFYDNKKAVVSGKLNTDT
jgi:hypothetical protein